MLIEKISRPYGACGFEIVEKKGLGHPDTLCDGVSDAVSRSLCQYYMDHFGRIMHHNVDKVLLIGGRSSPRFGGGEVLRPLAVIIGGRATDDVGGAKVPVQDIAREAAEKFLRATLKNIGHDFIVEPRIGVGSAELRGLAGKALANDTSIGIGFAPLSHLEEDALRIEPLMRSVKGVGEDVKVMGIRRGGAVHFTLAAAIVSKYVKDREQYEDIKVAIEGEVLKQVAAGWDDAAVAVNAADRGEDIYLTVTGTSAEMGDDGETGRGNRFNGLITPGRPMTMEATAGKNPVSHVGKIYNVVADRAAREIAGLDGVEEAYVYLVSKIGAPLDEPQIKAARIYGDADEKKVESIVDYWLEQIPGLAEDFIKGKF
ncbi:methionine adenosyltransferase [Methanocella conradii]|uniref:methionine adenosyltransferase n=1 Tax=Methanocella conradii TaxID=1175444 RepID=UPI00157D89DD|nr:methionine adenosyltransferase [Methanocella conradii]